MNVHRCRAILAVFLLLLTGIQLVIPTGAFAAVGTQLTGTRHLSGMVSNLSVDPAEVDQPPVRLRFQFKNDGNVEARPVVRWQITNGSGTAVGSVTYQVTAVQPGAAENIVSEWDQTGQYRATGSVPFEGTVTETQQVTFNATIVAHNTSRASTTTAGTLTLAKVNQWLVPGLVLLAVMVLAVGTMMVLYHRRDRRRRLSKFTTAGVSRPVVPFNSRPEDERFSRGVFFHRVPPTRPTPPKPDPAPEARKSILKPISTGPRKRQ